MTEQQRPEDDVEGHRRHFFEDPQGTEVSEDDVEGHTRRPQLDDEESADDVEGHRSRFQQSEDGDDDVEGHSNVARRPL
jgi:hypothetical protein